MLHLAAGSDTTEKTFEAKDPRSFSQTIDVTVTPKEASIIVDFRTAGGSTVHLDLGSADCNDSGDTRRCVVHLPILEAQLPGQWTAVATKSSGPAVSLELSIHWQRSSS